MVQEHRRKSLNERSDRQATSRVSPQHKNVFTTRDDSYMSTEMHEDTIPVKSKINNERKSKRYSKPTNNVNTNNRRMTGNVNIYICSETNSPERSKRRLKLQSCTETSSDITTERSNSRCISASSASSCKLLNSIQEKRRKLQAKQLTNSVHQEKDGSSDNSDNAVRDDKILHGSYRKELSESSKEQINIKVTDEDTECQDAISRDSTRDGCCCKDPSFSSTDLPQDSLDSVIPRLHFNECDESACSWTTIYPLETRAKMDDSDGSSLNAICMGRGTRYGNDERSNVCRNVRSTTCDAIDGSSWLPRSIYTDCAKVDGDVPKECFTNSGKYRNERLQKPMLNRNDIWWKQAGCKLPQEPLRDSRKEPTTRRWPTCSCIVEEEEDRCANVGRGDKESSEDPCDNVECPKKISVCQIPSSALVETVTVCETPFRNAEKHCEETPACESPLGDSAECPRAAIPCGTTFENSEEPPKVTRVCKEFVAGEPPKDIAVCGTTVGEPKGPPEEVTVCKSSLLDSGEAPKETISKTIPDSNFASQEDVDSVSLNDAKDKLVRENTDMANLNNQKENAGNVGSMVQSNDKSNIVSNNLTKLTFAKNVTQNERTKGNVLNNRSRNPIVPVGSVEYSKQRVSRNVYSTALARMEFPNRPNFTSNHNPQEILKIPIDKRGAAKMRSPLNRPTKIHLEQQNKVLKDLTTRDLTSSKNNQVDEKIQENSKEKEEVQDIPKEKEMAEEKPRESILHTSLKKLIDVIKHYRVQLKDKIETKNIEVKETVIDDKEDVTQLESISETREKIDDEKERRDVNKETHIKEIGDTVHVARPKPTAPIADFTVPEESKKADQVTSSENQTHLMPKLLRIIAAKRSHLLPIVTATTEPKRQEPKVESVPVEIPINEYVTREETVQEKVIPHVEPFPQEEVILQEESILQKEVSEEPIVQFTEERKKEVSLVPEIGEVEATAKEIIDISESVVGKDIVSEDFTRAVIKVDVPCSKKIERKDESQGVVSCKYESLSDPFDYTCSTAKCTEVRIACPQKKLEEEQDESIACKCKLHPVSKDCSRFIAKCKYNNAFDDCVCKINELEQKKDCTHCHLSIEQCICASTQYLKSCLKINKPKFRDISSLKDSPHICTNYCKEKKECMCRENVCYIRCQSYEDCRCKYTACNNCSRMTDRNDYRCRSPARCIYHAQSRNQSWHPTFGLTERRKIKKSSCNCKKAMICVYCDNPQDKCACRAPIGKCSLCGLSSDVCDCQNGGGDDSSRKRVVGEPYESRTIQVTSWKPKREIRRYFARDPADLRSDSTEECRCCERLKWQRPEELPYQRLNVFSDVMSELQQKMSESIYCTRCRRNPCRCGSQVDQDERVEGRKANGYVRCPEVEKSPRSEPSRSKSPRSKSRKSKSPRNTSPSNCRCNSSPGNERKSTVKKSAPIRRVGCVCKQSPCGCRKGRLSHRRPLAKCYYCKNLPCICIIPR